MPKRKDTEKAIAGPSAKKGKEGKKPNETTLLAMFMEYHMGENHNVTFEVFAQDIGCHKSNNAWRAVWKSIKDEGYIEPASDGKGFKMSEKGIEMAMTPEIKAHLEKLSIVPQTNEEHQERIKNSFKKRLSPKLFDVLMNHGALTRYELAGLVRKKDRSHEFSYALQELKKKQLVEPEPCNSGALRKIHLSDKAFLKPEDRPEPDLLDPRKLAEAVSWNKSCSPRTGVRISKDNKPETGDDDEGDKAHTKVKNKRKKGKSDEAHDEENDIEKDPDEDSVGHNKNEPGVIADKTQFRDVGNTKNEEHPDDLEECIETNHEETDVKKNRKKVNKVKSKKCKSTAFREEGAAKAETIFGKK
jgi:hypothetical protein